MKPILSLFLFLLSGLAGRAQLLIADTSKVQVADVKFLSSAVLGEKRMIYVYRPSASPHDRLPVIYLLDGDAHIAAIASQVQYLAEMYRQLPSVMIVAVANFSYDRFRDLTPSHTIQTYEGGVDSSRMSSGGADKFLDFMEKELIPWTEKNYATAPYRVLSGHSLGGLFALHALNSRPALFNAYIAASPSLWWDNRKLLKEITGKRTTGNNRMALLYMTDADEGPDFHEAVLKADSFFAKQRPASFSHRYKYHPEETHGSVPLRTNVDGLRFIFADWLPQRSDSTLGALRRKFEGLSKRLGVPLSIPDATLMQLAGEHMMQGNVAAATEVVDYLISSSPKSFLGYAMKGDLAERQGDKAGALALYQKAAGLNPDEPELKRRIALLQQ